MIDENKIYDYIEGYIFKNQQPPTQAEIMRKFHIAKGTVKLMLDRLILEGKISLSYDENGNQKERSIKIGSNGSIDYEHLENPFWHNEELRRKIKDIVKDYKRKKRRLREIMDRDALSRSNDMDGTPRGTDLSDTTAQLAIMRADYEDLRQELEIIEEARDNIDPYYRDAVWAYCTDRYANQINVPMKYNLSPRTLVRYQTRFYVDVAQRLGLL